jgi:hypothetical protein
MIPWAFFDPPNEVCMWNGQGFGSSFVEPSFVIIDQPNMNGWNL